MAVVAVDIDSALSHLSEQDSLELHVGKSAVTLILECFDHLSEWVHSGTVIASVDFHS